MHRIEATTANQNKITTTKKKFVAYTLANDTRKCMQEKGIFVGTEEKNSFHFDWKNIEMDYFDLFEL